MEQDWYDVLGVPSGAAADEIKSAYRALALKLHPDRNPDDPGAASKFALVNSAYEVLGDPSERRSYDLARRPAPVAAPQRPETPRGEPAKTWAPPAPAVKPDARGLTARQAAGRAIVVAGLAMAARGFFKAYGGPESGQDGAFLLYLSGMAVLFCGIGVLMRRGSDPADPNRPWWWF